MNTVVVDIEKITKENVKEVLKDIDLELIRETVIDEVESYITSTFSQEDKIKYENIISNFMMNTLYEKVVPIINARVSELINSRIFDLENKFKRKIKETEDRFDSILRCQLEGFRSSLLGEIKYGRIY